MNPAFSLVDNSLGLFVAKFSFSSLRDSVVSRLNSLSAAERAQLADFGDPDLAQRFLMRRAMLRDILAFHLRVDVGELAIQFDQFGKPSLADGRAHFSCASSGDIGMVCIGSEPVGVDIEMIRPENVQESVLDMAFSEPERQYLASLDSPARIAEFHRGWTIKEAVLKLRGGRLGTDMREIPALICNQQDRNLEIGNVAVGHEYAASVAKQTRA